MTLIYYQPWVQGQTAASKIPKLNVNNREKATNSKSNIKKKGVSFSNKVK